MKLSILFWNVKGRDAKASTAALEHLPPRSEVQTPDPHTDRGANQR